MAAAIQVSGVVLVFSSIFSLSALNYVQTVWALAGFTVVVVVL